MNELLQVPIIIGLFLLRLGVPIAITVAVGYWLHKLDAKWEAEAQQRVADLSKADPLPVSNVTIRPQPQINIERLIKERCWDIKQCAESIRAQCPACSHPDLPCWVARSDAEGHILKKCLSCQIYEQGQEAQPTVSQ